MKEQTHVEDFILKQFGEYAVNGFDVEKAYGSKINLLTDLYNERERLYEKIFNGYLAQFATSEEIKRAFVKFARTRMENWNRSKKLITCP